MATSTNRTAGKPHALSEAVRAAGHEKVAAKLEALHALHAPLREEHRPLTAEEAKLQRENALSVAELRAAQAVEYGTWVAVEDIMDGAAYAYHVGQPVPVSNVEAHGYDELGLVRRVKPERTKPEPAATEAKS